ncbi:hypothetical protein LB505_009276 [Fusarium chuoi]|nr:hypothetical protein LB505_009276 [Fusarium chuoi]
MSLLLTSSAALITLTGWHQLLHLLTLTVASSLVLVLLQQMPFPARPTPLPSRELSRLSASPTLRSERLLTNLGLSGKTKSLSLILVLWTLVSRLFSLQWLRLGMVVCGAFKCWWALMLSTSILISLQLLGAPPWLGRRVPRLVRMRTHWVRPSVT